MKYNPVRVKFRHLSDKTAVRKISWFGNTDLDTDIEVRRCAVYNKQIGKYGAWDSDKCTTVVSEQSTTVCECGTFGTYALVAEKVEDPFMDAEYEWLKYVKYAGWIISIVLLLVFIVVVLRSP